MTKGFKDDKGKFRPTEKKTGVSSKDVSLNPDDKKPSKVNQDSADKIKKKKSLDEIISIEVEERIENLDEDEYDDFLDEGDLNQLVEDYSFSRVLKETDPTAYNVGFNDWQDSRLTDMEREINREAISQAEEELDDELDKKDLTDDQREKIIEEKLDDLIEEKEDKIREEKEDELDEEQYDDFLDEVGTGDNEILGAYSRILKEIDPTAYRVGFSDWTDGERDRIADEVKDDIDEELSLELQVFTE